MRFYPRQNSGLSRVTNVNTSIRPVIIPAIAINCVRADASEYACASPKNMVAAGPAFVSEEIAIATACSKLTPLMLSPTVSKARTKAKPPAIGVAIS